MAEDESVFIYIVLTLNLFSFNIFENLNFYSFLSIISMSLRYLIQI
jgi:hypothetical protein